MLPIALFGDNAYAQAMRSSVLTELEAADSQELLSTGDAARLLGASRQHIVDLCESGELPYVTTGRHRRVYRSDLEALRSRTHRLTRDQLRSLWLSHAVAGKLVQQPDEVLETARRNLRHLQERHTRGQASHWLLQWERILNGSIEGVLNALTSSAPKYRELRQNSPFAGVLTEHERREVLNSFQRFATAARREAV
jgi:excisionase family DNA binding protein